MSQKKAVPVAVTDFIMHAKVDDDCTEGMERVLFPFTRYSNILNSPKVVSKTDDAPGAPFALLRMPEYEEEMDISDIRELCGEDVI